MEQDSIPNNQPQGVLLRESAHSIFSPAWMSIALILLAVGFWLDRNPGLLTLGFMLLTIAGISHMWKQRALIGVTYERSFDHTRVFPDEPVEITAVISNNKILPLTWLRISDNFPIAPAGENPIAQSAAENSESYPWKQNFSMAGHEQAERHVTLQFPTRGYYRIGPVQYSSSDIFMLFTVEQKRDYLDTIVVYPQIWPLAELGLPAKEPFGDVKVRHSLFTDPIKTQGIRDYQQQDRFRDVHWKASARRGQLQTKVYDPSTGMTMVVFLNVATFAKHWMGFDPILLERAVSVAGSIANYGAGQGWAVGMYANGSLPNSDQPIRVPAGRSPDQLMHILEALAAVTEFATGSIERMLFRESAGLPWAATMVLITAVVTEEIMINLIRLKEAGRRIVLITLADEPPPLNAGGIVVYHIPATLPAFQAQSQSATEAALHNLVDEERNR